MKKFLTIFAVVAALFMVAGCSDPTSGNNNNGGSSSSGSYSITNAPAWLQGSWADELSICELNVSKGKFEIMTIDYADDMFSSLISDVSGDDTTFKFKIDTQSYTFEKDGDTVKVTIVTDNGITDPETAGPYILAKK